MNDTFYCAECGAVRYQPAAAHGGKSPDGYTDPICQRHLTDGGSPHEDLVALLLSGATINGERLPRVGGK